jgi:hypothetical protein
VCQPINWLLRSQVSDTQTSETTAEADALRLECLNAVDGVSPGQQTNRETGLLCPVRRCWAFCECVNLGLIFFGEVGLRLAVSKFFDT